MAKIYKRGETWWARVSYRGKEYRRSLDTKAKGVAGERLLTFIGDVKAGKWGDKPRRKFDEAVNKFIDEHFPRIKPASRKRYRVSLMNLASHMVGMYLDEIGSAVLSDFEVARRASGVTDSTIRRDLVCLGVVFSCAEDWEWSDHNPVKPYLKKARQRGLVEGNPKDRFLSNAEERDLFTHVRNLIDKATHLRDAHGYRMQEAAFAFAIDTGLREEEMFTLVWSQIDMGKRQVRVLSTQAKNKRMREVPLLPRTLNLLSTLPRSKHSELVFWHADGRRYSQMYHPLRRRCAEAGIAPCSFHDLRRTCGIRLLRDHHLSMDRVSSWLGHSGIKVTEKVYAFIAVDDLHRAVENSHTNGHRPDLVDRRTYLKVVDS